MSSIPEACPVCAYPAWQSGAFGSYDFTRGEEVSLRPLESNGTLNVLVDFDRLEASFRTFDCQGCKLLCDVWSHAEQDTCGALSKSNQLFLFANRHGHLGLLHSIQGRTYGDDTTLIDLFTLPGQLKPFSLRIGGVPDRDTGSEASWRKALEWIGECTSRHNRCRLVDDSGFIPDRLVDVDHGPGTVQVVELGLAKDHKSRSHAGNTQDGRSAQTLAVEQSKFSRSRSFLSKSVRASVALADRLNRIQVPGSAPRLSKTETAFKYMTLSHCWGNSRSHLLLTTNTFEQHTGINGITIAELPRTFQDAIMLTMKLGVRYLWIDSLCIMQDSEQDWHTQSAQMASIYSHSWLTLAATASTSDNDGFFPAREERHQSSKILRKPVNGQPRPRGFSFEPHQHTLHRNGQQYTFYSRIQLAHPDETHRLPPISELPLLSRGWIFQERLLSRRVLHFGHSELLWECMSGVGCECNPIPPSQWRSDPSDPETFLGRDIQSKSWYSALRARKSSKAMLHNDWRRACLHYSRLKLTVADDRLTAISGVAKQFRSVIKDDYLAGFWRKSLREMLCWDLVVFPTEKPRPETGTPTWSWAAAAEGGVSWTLCMDYLMEVLAAETCPVTADETGRVRGGRLDVRGVVSRALIRPDSNMDQDAGAQDVTRGLRIREYEFGTEMTGIVDFKPDCQFWTDRDDLLRRLSDVTLLWFGRRPDAGTSLFGLVLMKKFDSSGEQVFERIGRLGVLSVDLSESLIMSKFAMSWQRLTLI